MMNEMKLAVLGGDARQIAMARHLARAGYSVTVWGLGACAEQIAPATTAESWESAILTADAVILPLPASADGIRLSCPLGGRDCFLRMTALLDAATGKYLFGGRLSSSLRSIAEQKSVEWVDYYDSEVLQLKNAVPTAEGAIAIAMERLPITLDGCSAAVIGYGRIGQVLSAKLGALGARVTVYARRAEQLTLAEIHRHGSKRLLCKNGKSLPEDDLSGIRVVFNTVPHRIFTREVLEKIPSNCLLIDLASIPGGIDHVAATELGIESVWGTALPGKCAPESAGVIIADTLLGILETL